MVDRLRQQPTSQAPERSRLTIPGMRFVGREGNVNKYVRDSAPVSAGSLTVLCDYSVYRRDNPFTHEEIARANQARDAHTFARSRERDDRSAAVLHDALNSSISQKS